MSEHNSLRDGSGDFRQLLRIWEDTQHKAPAYGTIQHRIAETPSAMDAPPWSIRQSARLAVVLAWAQLRVVPWLVLPVGLVTVAMAIFTAQFFGVTQGGTAGDSGFTIVMLAGVVVTVTMALSSPKADSVALATPIAPQAVVLARVTLMLVIDSMAGLAASGLVSAWGYTNSLPEVVASWLYPVTLVAGAATFAAVWVSPLVGSIAGIALIPLATPASDGIFFIGLSGLLWNTLTPLGVLGTGAFLLSGAVVSARQAAVNRLQPA
ncbi:MAG: hypothetical protein Q4C81_09425 [Kocuria sp.]|nr:hypothetical protein [Kocuria sp.]